MHDSNRTPEERLLDFQDKDDRTNEIQFKFIEACCRFSGYLIVSNLCEAFGLTRFKAMEVLSDYRLRNPGSLVVSAGKHTRGDYKPNIGFTSIYLTTNPKEYLDAIKVISIKPIGRL